MDGLSRPVLSFIDQFCVIVMILVAERLLYDKEERRMRHWFRFLGLLVLVLTACGQPAAVTSPPLLAGIETTPAATLGASPSTETGALAVLRLATTTSTADTGLLDLIVPDFEQQYAADVQVIAVGTGQALKLGENGDADVLLVHAREREDEFVVQGFGINRRDVMYNDYVLVGPDHDPAEAREASNAAEAFVQIAGQEATFASRGDDSGTHTKEQTIWATASITPNAQQSWYRSLGQGMGETLIAANELDAYTLTDRGTFLSMRASLPNLEIVVGGETVDQNPDPALRNLYGVIAVNPERHPGIQTELANAFIDWITSPETQARIGEFGIEEYGQPLFYPAAQ